jgi:hypothetical protein
MSVMNHFSATYAEARDKFLKAATAAGGALESYPHPLKGPDGGDLSMDIAWFGPRDAKRLLIISSGTHGVEGYCGSGIQVGLLDSGIAGELSDNSALLLVHAHNPHGFAWQRRVTEDNVDLNRNFRDYNDIPRNEAYAGVHDMLIPTDWDGPAREAADKAIAAYMEEHGVQAFQSAVGQGQHDFPDGLFFGGNKPTWSRTNMEKMARKYCCLATDVAMLDLHTGLGPRGYGEMLFVEKGIPAEWERAQAWYGKDEVGNPSLGTSVSTPVTGTMDGAYRPALQDGANYTGCAIEYGTLSQPEVKNALRGDHWLYKYGELDSDQGRQIKKDIRAAFFGEDEKWQQDVYDRGLWATKKALAGLAAS